MIARVYFLIVTYGQPRAGSPHGIEPVAREKHLVEINISHELSGETYFLMEH